MIDLIYSLAANVRERLIRQIYKKKEENKGKYMCESFASFSLWIDTHHSFDQEKCANYHAEIILIYEFFLFLVLRSKVKIVYSCIYLS